MLTVAYLANQFPSPVEPYVSQEIGELRNRGLRVIAGSVKRPVRDHECGADIVLQPLNAILLLHAFWLCLRHVGKISPLIGRILFRGREGPIRRMKALLHTLLGACYAVKLKARGKSKIDHIHAHHGYCGSWIAMVAARMLGAGFSLTLHGSDLLLRADYLDVKLADCRFCLTVSEFNRQHILECYPETEPRKVLVSRLGVELKDIALDFFSSRRSNIEFTLLAVGRLHKVKDHAFLIRACRELQAHGIRFECSIAGEGPERHKLKSLIRKLGLEDRVTLLGHVDQEQMDSLYDRADVVVLTSRSEGIPLVLMEAMAHGKVVLAPAITGIPELVQHYKTGFLYEAGSLEDFLQWLLCLHSALQTESRTKADAGLQERHPHTSSVRLAWVRLAARLQIRHNFNRITNLKSFADLFIRQIATRSESPSHENSVLQQIQLSLQRNRSVPLRIDGIDAGSGARSRPVLHV